MSKKIEKFTFEEALEHLETILESMEDGEIPLTELISKFEEGSTILKTCMKKLREAELKIEKLNKETSNLEHFENQESND